MNKWPQRWEDLSKRKNKLKLRPMDDITIEEARQILQFRSHVDISDAIIIARQEGEEDIPELRYISINAFDHERKLIANTVYTPNQEQLFTPEEVVFFLSKKIDIFGYNKLGITTEVRTRKGDLNN